MVQLDGGRFATSDLNDLYRRVINRNNRLKRLLELGAPEIIIRNEKRMLQEAVDSLIDNGRRGRAVAGSGNHKLKSLSDMLKGKQGRFRQNLLGKRVDYSGRSVIVVGPELKLHQCGLPKRMALELFKPFVMHALVARGLAHNIKSAKRIVERARPEVWDVLDEVIHDAPGAAEPRADAAPPRHPGVRAGADRGQRDPDPPAGLHGVQRRLRRRPDGRARAAVARGGGRGAPDHALDAQPALAGFRRADHRADAGHGARLLLPDGREAERAGRYKAAKNGTPTEGCTAARRKRASRTTSASSTCRRRSRCACRTRSRRAPKLRARRRTRCAGAAGGVDLDDATASAMQTPTRCRRSTIAYVVTDGVGAARPAAGRSEIIETTVGPADLRRDPARRRRVADDGRHRLHQRHDGPQDAEESRGACYDVLGNEDTAEVVDNIKRIGFEYATQSGITIAVNDLRVPAEKAELIEEAEQNIREIDGEYETGLITEQERYDATVEVWSRTTEDVKKTIQNQLDRYGSVYTMATSGAKGNISQITQMAGMRGLMTDPSGRIIDLPIRSSFREGLTVLEYFISTHGARKGLADTALRTADSGYLTRRLIDVAQDVIILEEDCGTRMGVWLDQPEAGVLESFSERIIGRYSAMDLEDPETGEMLAAFNEEIDEQRAARIEQLEAWSACTCARALTCQAKRGICRYCYGRSPARGCAGDDGRGRRHRRGAVDRRAGHAADDAHVPHRWCGERRRHHERSAARRGAVRGARAEGPGADLARSTASARSCATATRAGSA